MDWKKRLIKKTAKTYVRWLSCSAQAIKNEAEIAGMREAHLRDAVAMATFLCFVEKEVAAGKTFTEVQIDEELTARRKAQEGYVETSFSTIAGDLETIHFSHSC